MLDPGVSRSGSEQPAVLTVLVMSGAAADQSVVVERQVEQAHPGELEPAGVGGQGAGQLAMKHLRSVIIGLHLGRQDEEVVVLRVREHLRPKAWRLGPRAVCEQYRDVVVRGRGNTSASELTALFPGPSAGKTRKSSSAATGNTSAPEANALPAASSTREADPGSRTSVTSVN